MLIDEGRMIRKKYHLPTLPNLTKGSKPDPTRQGQELQSIEERSIKTGPIYRDNSYGELADSFGKTSLNASVDAKKQTSSSKTNT